ncbi:hypothetical protein MRX96_004660 [Rhipicephalus microplus]
MSAEDRKARKLPGERVRLKGAEKPSLNSLRRPSQEARKPLWQWKRPPEPLQIEATIRSRKRVDNLRWETTNWIALVCWAGSKPHTGSHCRASSYSRAGSKPWNEAGDHRGIAEKKQACLDISCFGAFDTVQLHWPVLILHSLYYPGAIMPDETWEGAANTADSKVAEGVKNVKYYEEPEGTTRDGERGEMQCADTIDAKVMSDVDGAASAKEGIAARVLENDT